jgi:hypothetical protein
VTPHTLNILLGLSTVGFVVVALLYMIHLHDTKWKLLSKDNKIRHLESELRHYSSLYFSGCACKKNHATLTAEIELLRSTVTDCRIEIESTRAQRDDARREICMNATKEPYRQMCGSGILLPQDAARERNWDCFKERDDAQTNP